MLWPHAALLSRQYLQYQENLFQLVTDFLPDWTVKVEAPVVDDFKMVRDEPGMNRWERSAVCFRMPCSTVAFISKGLLRAHFGKYESASGSSIFIFWTWFEA